MNNGTLILIDSTVSDNKATNAVGGGIYGVGDLILKRATVSDNEPELGGGLFSGGAVSALTRTRFTNSTVSGNRVQSHGGGIFTEPATEPDLRNAMIANNVAESSELGVEASLARRKYSRRTPSWLGTWWSSGPITQATP